MARAAIPFSVAAMIAAQADARPSPAVPPAALVGVYDGGQPEVAAALDLRADGRFRYVLSYGAIDEEAAGTWRWDGSRVLLTSDGVSPPRFVLLDRRDGPAGRLIVALDLPDGMSRQYFHVEARLDDGTTIDRQFGEDGSALELILERRATAVALTLPVFGLRTTTVLRGGGGHRLRFRFEPRDLGKVAFAGTALPADRGALLLIRHDRTIRFRRTKASDTDPGR